MVRMFEQWIAVMDRPSDTDGDEEQEEEEEQDVKGDRNVGWDCDTSLRSGETIGATILAMCHSICV